MLEDDFTYVIRKAFKGLALAPGEAASRAGLSENAGARILTWALLRGNRPPPGSGARLESGRLRKA